MNFFKKFAIYAGLAGWVIAIAVSLTQYRLIAGQQCAFISAWPFCDNVTTVGQAVGQVALLASFFAFLVWSGILLFKSFEKGEKISLSKNAIYCVIVVSLVGAFLLAPFASADLEYYFSAGKALDAGQNLYVGQWHLQNQFIDPVHDGQAGEIMYGPIMLPLLAVFYRMSVGNIILFILLWKLFMIAIFALCGYLVYRLIRTRILFIDSKSFAFVWTTQPLLLFEWVGNGHFDGLWLLTVLVAFLLARNRRWLAVFPVLAVGVWIKFIPLLIAPWFVLWWWQETNKENWKRSIGQLIGAGIASVLITYASWKPFWAGTGVFKAILLQSKWAVSSIFSVVYYSFAPLFQMILGEDRAHWVLTRLVQGGLLLVVFYLLYPYLKKVIGVLLKRQTFSEQGYQMAVFISMLVYLLMWQKSFWPWYFSWLIPLGFIAFAGSCNSYWMKIGGWIGTAPLLFYIPWMGAKGNADGLWFYWYVVLVIMAYPLWQLIQWRKKQYGEIS